MIATRVRVIGRLQARRQHVCADCQRMHAWAEGPRPARRPACLPQVRALAKCASTRRHKAELVGSDARRQQLPELCDRHDLHDLHGVAMNWSAADQASRIPCMHASPACNLAAELP